MKAKQVHQMFQTAFESVGIFCSCRHCTMTIIHLIINLKSALSPKKRKLIQQQDSGLSFKFNFVPS